jgi:type IV secretion system protein VirB9
VRYSINNMRIPYVEVQEGDVCDIILQPGERINQVVIADSLRWKITDGLSHDTPHVFIKPTEANLHTSLIITTNLRSYHIRFASVSGEGREVIGFYYPEAPRRIIVHQSAPINLPQWTCAAPLDSHYKFKTSKHNNAFTPLSACNDGVRTYINMNHIDGALPVLYTVGADGTDQLVGNATWNPPHNEFIIDGVPNSLALVRDSRHGQLRVNIEKTDK